MSLCNVAFISVAGSVNDILEATQTYYYGQGALQNVVSTGNYIMTTLSQAIGSLGIANASTKKQKFKTIQELMIATQGQQFQT